MTQHGPIPQHPIRKFMRHVKFQANGCWLWTGYISPKGYAIFEYEGGQRASRFAYSIFVRAIPEGLQIDHLCRNRACVNPNHLEPVTCKENLLRGLGFNSRNAQKSQCPQGHPYDMFNTYIKPNGSRDCRICRYEAVKRWQNKQKQEVLL